MAKPSWITLSKTSGEGGYADTVIVTAAKNTGTSARSGSITVKSGSMSKVVTISQAGPTYLSMNFDMCTISVPYSLFSYNMDQFIFSVEVVLDDGSTLTSSQNLTLVRREDQAASSGILRCVIDNAEVERADRITEFRIYCAADTTSSPYTILEGKLNPNQTVVFKNQLLDYNTTMLFVDGKIEDNPDEALGFKPVPSSSQALTIVPGDTNTIIPISMLPTVEIERIQ